MHRKSIPTALAYLLIGAFTLILAACGSSSSSSSSSGGTSTKGGKKGGNLLVLAESDVDNFDPGVTYEQFSFEVFSTVDRQLYGYIPPNYDKPVPDLAVGPPQISADAKTVTVKIKPNVHYSPPLQTRTVTSADVKYAFERAFTAQVPNPYMTAYFNDLVGAPTPPAKKYTPIPGITTPDTTTIVFHVSKPTGGLLAAALVLPASSPVPKDYAFKYDQSNPSTYPQHQVFTGPYMVKNDGKGNITGHSPGQELDMVRNPGWNASTDFRPAYVDAISIREGITDPVSATRKIIAGKGIMEGNTVPPPSLLKSLYTGPQKAQLAFAPGGGSRYISLNSTIKPFDNINVRKAISSCMDRDALRLSRGGPLLGAIPTHVIPPGMPGFDPAGGLNGPGYDWLASPTGNKALCAKYWKAAGYPGGKYTGSGTFLMVGESSGVPAKTAEVAAAQFQAMGFKINLKQVPHDIMYQKFCNVPAQKVAICPNTGFFKDFQDSQTLLDLPFNGERILPTGNSNWPQLNIPAVNKAIDKLSTITDPTVKAAAAAEVDKMVTAQASVVPWLWDKTPLTRSADVKSVPNAYTSSWDFGFTSVGG